MSNIKPAPNLTDGFRLADEDYAGDIISVLENLINYPHHFRNFEEMVDFDEQKKILELIGKQTGAVTIHEQGEPDFEIEDGRYIYHVAESDVRVNDKQFLEELWIALEHKLNDIYDTGVAKLLKKQSSIAWSCVKCGRPFHPLTAADKVREWLDNFAEHNYLICKKDSTRNWFEITEDGDIHFHGFRND